MYSKKVNVFLEKARELQSRPSKVKYQSKSPVQKTRRNMTPSFSSNRKGLNGRFQTTSEDLLTNIESYIDNLVSLKSVELKKRNEEQKKDISLIKVMNIVIEEEKEKTSHIRSIEKAFKIRCDKCLNIMKNEIQEIKQKTQMIKFENFRLEDILKHNKTDLDKRTEEIAKLNEMMFRKKEDVYILNNRVGYWHDEIGKIDEEKLCEDVGLNFNEDYEGVSKSLMKEILENGYLWNEETEQKERILREMTEKRKRLEYSLAHQEDEKKARSLRKNNIKCEVLSNKFEFFD